MGTWRWFSVEHCDATSSCVVVDAWLQLFLCVSAVLFLLLVFLACCLRSCRLWSSRLPLLSRFLPGSTTSSRSKTAPMPMAVIKNDADMAHISGHKNSLKQASEFMRQTQRISKTDFATTDKDARTSEGRKLSFINRIGSSLSLRRNSRNTTEDEAATERRRASHDMTHPRSSDAVPPRKLSNPLPLRRSSTSRRGSLTTSSIEMDAILSKAAGFNCDRESIDGPNLDAVRRSSKTDVDSRVDRNSSFRHRITSALYPTFIRAMHAQRPSIPMSTTTAPSSSTSTEQRAKKAPLERSATTFEMPSYRKRQKLAALPLEHRNKKERRGSVELRDKRRLSIGRDAQIRFHVSDGHEASVYEVKLKEITLVKRLAFGPLSEVYAAIWRDTRVGVKLLMPREGVTDRLEEAVKNFRREIWVMNALKHPNIVKLIGASLTPTCYVLVMEYMSNGSLYEYLRDEANFFPHQMVLTSALDIADGMRHLHASGVLQRDLKSKNCLVSENLVVKVADFGLSRFAERRTPNEQYTFVGTPFWAAPEVIRHEPYDHKADIYSFAIVLWELVERKDPYEQLNAFQVPLQVANDGLRPDDFTRSAPLGLEQLMKQCWDANPDQRPSFDEIVETLQKWLAPTADDDLKVESEADDLSAHVQRERHCATENELHRFASSHDANARAIPIVLSRGKTDRLLLSAHHQRRSSAVAMGFHVALPHRTHSERSISPASNHSMPF